jgi:hypothetical protein
MQLRDTQATKEFAADRAGPANGYLLVSTLFCLNNHGPDADPNTNS